MGSSEERVVAVIMVGGPTKGTRFRPLSLNIPEPLFQLAGQPMVHHPITACQRADRDYSAKLGITILGEAVVVEDEVVVINSIVLPNKNLNASVQEEIIL